MTTAFVLSGGASHGAVQVGMLQARAGASHWLDVIGLSPVDHHSDADLHHH